MTAPAFKPDPSQARVLDHAGGALLASGGPGTGKTSVLRERFARMVEAGADPERVAMFTLTRRAAREARDQLTHRLARSLAEVPVFTAHGYAFRALSSRFRELDYTAPPRVLSAPEQYAEVRGLLFDQDPADWPRFGHLLEVPSFAQQVADFVMRCQERLLEPDHLDAMVGARGRDDLAEVARFYRRYLDSLNEGGQVDFAGLLFQTVSLIEGNLPADARFEHVLVDDYQDATPAAEAIVRALGRAAETAVVAADPGGHVFSFRGGSLEPLERIEEAFPGIGRVRLEGDHRLGGRGPALAGLDGDRPVGGVEGPALRGFEARLHAHPGEEVEAVATELLRLRVDLDLPWSEMAVVLRRHGPHLTILRHALTRHAIPFVVVAESSVLASEPAVRPLVDLLRFVYQPARRDQLLEPLLGSPLAGLDPVQVRALRREARKLDRSLLELVEDPTVELPAELAPAVGRFRALVDDVPGLAGRLGPDGLFFELWRSRMPRVAELVAGADDGAGGQRDLDALAALGSALSRFVERRPGSSIEDWLETLDAAEFGPEPWIPPEERHPDAVRVISAHRAQGLEFEAVMVAGCIEGEFPSLSGGAPLVSVDGLLEPDDPDGPGPASRRIAARLAEERALFRLAVSRARRSTVLFASASTGSRTTLAPSRFATRMGLAWAPAERGSGPSVSLRGMETELRRRLSDPAADPGERLAAAAALPLVGAEPARWWGRRRWSGTGAPLHPEEQIWTSYSHLSTLENCALQYLLNDELGLDPASSHQMWVGSLVHDLIDQVQRGELPRDLDALRRTVDQAWRAEVFPNRVIERRRYHDVLDMLARWIRGEREQPLASEQWFEFPIDGAVIRGRIDAIFPMENGHVRVVDYKTGRWVPTQKEVDDNLQLASYYLAVTRAPQFEGMPEPGYLQLAYLGAARQQAGFAAPGTTPKKRDDYGGWAQGRLLELLGRIRAEEFAPNPEAECRFCAFKTICPRWPEGGEAPVRRGGAVTMVEVGP